MRKRTLAREFVLKIFYQAEMTRRELPAASEVFWSEKEKIEENVKEFSDMLVAGVQKNIKKIDEIIKKYAANWQLERMAVIDRNIWVCCRIIHKGDIQRNTS